MYRRGVSSRKRKLLIGGAAAALLGSALVVGTGMSQAAEQGNAGASSGNINALVPALGFSPGNPNATADRVGPTGVKVPGRCPPTQAQVNAQVALKNANLPSGTDLESRIRRFEKTLSAIQDLKCPASSTTLLGRLNSLTALRGNANRDNVLRGLSLNETPADKAGATGSGDAAAGGATGNTGATGNAGAGSSNIDALVPALGFSPGNPNATADRVGPTGVKVPGRCPPTQAQVNAQVALKNADLPGGTDLESRIRRFEKTLSAIQDLKCPASSTTLLGRLNSLTALRGNANRDNILSGLGLNETPADKAAGNAAP